MTADRALDLLREHGVWLRVEGDRVRMVAPRPPPADLVEEARSCRAELIELLGREAEECETRRRRLADVEAIGHHERRWVRGARVPEAVARRLEAGARATIAALREQIAEHAAHGGCASCTVVS